MTNKLCVYYGPTACFNTHMQKIDAAAYFGMAGVELLNSYEFDTPSIENAKVLKAYADEKGIKLPCFSVFCDVRESGATDKLKAYANVAKVLGCDYLHHTIIPEYADPDKVLPHKSEYFKKGIAAVREVYDYAEALGIKTVYEDQGYIFNGISGFGDFLAEVGRDVGVIADFGNICEADCTITDFINAFRDKICHVHVKDMLVTDSPPAVRTKMRTLSGKYVREVIPGTGSVDIPEAMRLLREMNYNGFYSAEFAVRTGDESADRAKFSELIKYISA